MFSSLLKTILFGVGLISYNEAIIVSKPHLDTKPSVDALPINTTSSFPYSQPSPLPFTRPPSIRTLPPNFRTLPPISFTIPPSLPPVFISIPPTPNMFPRCECFGCFVNNHCIECLNNDYCQRINGVFCE